MTVRNFVFRILEALLLPAFGAYKAVEDSLFWGMRLADPEAYADNYGVVFYPLDDVVEADEEDA